VFSDIAKKVIDQLFNIIYKSNIDESVFNQMLQMSSDLIEGKNGELPYLKANEYFMKLVKYGVTNFRDMAEILNSNSINNSNDTTINNTNPTNNSTNVENHTNYTESAKTPDFSFAFFKRTLASILGSMNINSLFYGYLEENDLENMKKNIIKFIGVNDSKKDLNKVNVNNSLNNTANVLNTFTMIDYLHAHKIISQPVTFKNTNNLKLEHNHIVENYFQVGTRDYKISLVMNIIEMIWGNMFYYYLRTIKQLGYIVSANKQIIDNFMVKIN
jgi:secreted Zn-dependent insulinase-like peptidase